MTSDQPSTAASLFQPSDSAELVLRLRRLRADSRPGWGKLDVAQMLAHCRQPLLVACGQLPLGRGLIGLLFGRLAKRKLLSGKPFDRNMPTHPKFRIARPGEFAAEREQLIALVERFAQEGPRVLSKQPHPFFGPLTEHEWDRLQWLHLDHHLRQFGV